LAGYWEAATMEQFVEDFLVYLRHERGQSENTVLTYHGLLKRFMDWEPRNNILLIGRQIELKHLLLKHEPLTLRNSAHS
jgi:site-specific recombinase XerD